MDSITIRFNTAGDAYSAHLSGPAIGDTRGDFDAPFSVSTWSAILRALAPNYRPDAQTEVLLAPLGDRSRLAEHAGARWPMRCWPTRPYGPSLRWRWGWR